MKRYIKSTILALGAVALLTGCDENAWNDKLDGFEVPEIGTAASSVTYTLTAADYNKIATNKPYTTYAAAQGEEATAALKLIGADCSFATDEQAREYLAMFLRDSTNNFFTLANGSAVKVTYNVAENLPETVKAITAGTSTYTVQEADYQAAWGSDDDFIPAFAPMTPANRAIPGLLKAQFPDAQAGQFAVVTYNEAATNPIFQQVGGGDDELQLSDVLGDAEVGDEVDVVGLITAIDKRGFVLTDATGSILCYQASGFDVETVAIGNVVEITAEVSAYGTGKQIAITDDSYKITGTAKYTYPEAKEYTGAMMDEAVQRAGNYSCEYVTFVGQAVISGNYLNFNVDGATASQGSGYQTPQFILDQITSGETYRITGYFASVSSKKFFNVVITSVQPATSKAPASRGAVVDVPSTVKNALYQFNGTAWAASNAAVVLQPSDYTAMSQTYGNLSGTLPAELLPIYLAKAYPYAAADDVVTVAYLYYASGAGTKYRAAEYSFNGSEWTLDAGAVTSQFVKQNGFWFYNPSVVLTLPYARNTDPSYTYYMACVNWVFKNIGEPMGGTSLTSSPFIDYRGNAEFYSGASAYYGNVDVRASTALNNAPEGYTGYEGLTDDEIVLLMEKRFCLEVLPGALSALHPDAAPVAGMDVTYTINFTAYETGGVAVERTVVYTVAGPGQFKYQNCTWFANGEDAEW